MTPTSNAPMPPHVVLVGHCRPDTSHLSLSVRKVLPNAKIWSVWSPQEIDKALAELPPAAPPAVLLVNRVLEPGFATESGIELIRDLKARYPALRVMLVSNFPDAQAQAVAAGALPGFGKNDLGTPRLAQVLQDAIK